MGSVRLGVPEELVLALKAASGIDTFIETGTYKGGTTRWAAKHFPRVFTMEGYEPRYHKTREALKDEGYTLGEHVSVIFGDSRTYLAQTLFVAAAPSIIWLDAHWCGEGAHDCNGNECPIMEELAAINADPHAAEHIILVDDARLFQAPPPYPHDPKQWPTIGQVEGALGSGLLTDRNTIPARWTTIYEDVIAAVPTEDRYGTILEAWKAGTLGK